MDLRAFKDITVDAHSNIARVGVGNRLGDIALTLAAHGRGIPHGTCPYVGIGGHAGMHLNLTYFFSSDEDLSAWWLRLPFSYVGFDP